MKNPKTTLCMLTSEQHKLMQSMLPEARSMFVIII